MKNIILLLVTFISVVSCNSEEILPAEKGEIYNENNPLLGYWVAGDYKEDIRTFTRANEFDPEKAGFAFFENGKLVERGNSGWCGTPPVSYTNYEGQWSVDEDNYLILNSTYWGGERTIAFEIAALDKNTLELKYIE